ncbi:MAG: hypothetical protein ACHP8A_07665, partial [Terriglobales bacterium]
SLFLFLWWHFRPEPVICDLGYTRGITFLPVDSVLDYWEDRENYFQELNPAARTKVYFHCFLIFYWDRRAYFRRTIFV